MKNLYIKVTALVVAFLGQSAYAGTITINKIINNGPKGVLIGMRDDTKSGASRERRLLYLAANTQSPKDFKPFYMPWIKNDTLTDPTKNFVGIATDNGIFRVVQGKNKLARNMDLVWVIDKGGLISAMPGIQSTANNTYDLVFDGDGFRFVEPKKETPEKSKK